MPKLELPPAVSPAQPPLQIVAVAMEGRATLPASGPQHGAAHLQPLRMPADEGRADDRPRPAAVAAMGALALGLLIAWSGMRLAAAFSVLPSYQPEAALAAPAQSAIASPVEASTPVQEIIAEQKPARHAVAEETAPATVPATVPAPAPASLRERIDALLARQPIEFEPAQATLTASGQTAVEALAQLLAGEREQRIRIEAHTDASGDSALNQRLSERRARAVRKALASAGVSSRRIAVAGMGDASPIADNTSEEGRRRNRRIEVSLR